MDTVTMVTLVADGASGDQELEIHMTTLLQELFEIFKAKQADYGAGNIAMGGERGCLIRANDKLQRLWRLVWEDGEAKNESVEDSWLDLADYALIALLVKRGKWPQIQYITRKEELV